MHSELHEALEYGSEKAEITLFCEVTLPLNKHTCYGDLDAGESHYKNRER
jgi:hypothetical protein